jgi:hypothetical protein
MPAGFELQIKGVQQWLGHSPIVMASGMVICSTRRSGTRIGQRRKQAAAVNATQVRHAGNFSSDINAGNRILDTVEAPDKQRRTLP